MRKPLIGIIKRSTHLGACEKMKTKQKEDERVKNVAASDDRWEDACNITRVWKELEMMLMQKLKNGFRLMHEIGQFTMCSYRNDTIRWLMRKISFKTEMQVDLKQLDSE